MAWYEISTDSLFEAEEMMRSCGDDFRMLCERLDRINLDIQEFQHLYREQKRMSGSMVDISADIVRIEQTLSQIAAIYAKAENSVFDCDSLAATARSRNPATSEQQLPKIIRRTNEVVLFGDLLMPDWLKVAVLKYEQSQIDKAHSEEG